MQSNCEKLILLVTLMSKNEAMFADSLSSCLLSHLLEAMLLLLTTVEDLTKNGPHQMTSAETIQAQSCYRALFKLM